MTGDGRCADGHSGDAGDDCSAETMFASNARSKESTGGCCAPVSRLLIADAVACADGLSPSVGLVVVEVASSATRLVSRRAPRGVRLGRLVPFAESRMKVVTSITGCADKRTCSAWRSSASASA